MFLIPMNRQQGIETIRKDFITNILQCFEGKLSIEKLISFAMSLTNNPDLANDPLFLQSITLLDFLSTQLKNGNKDLVSPQIVKESCTYLLSKLAPGSSYMKYMQAATMSVTQPTMLRGGVAKKPHTKLQVYLHHIGWETNRFTNAKLTCMLVASCLRYLGGREDIAFVVELAEEIRKKYKQTVELSLWYSIDILIDLSEKLRDKSIHPADTDTINELVNEAQKLITKRNYPDTANS